MNGLPFWFANNFSTASLAIDRHVDPGAELREATRLGSVVGTALFVAAHFDSEKGIWHSPRESTHNHIVIGDTAFPNCPE
eukprot:2831726-Ditylum_brightwellii.AAC.1